MGHRFTTAAAALALVAGPGGVALAMTDTEAEKDGSFLTMAHQGGLGEIAMGKDVKKNATTSCVRKTGEILVKDHTRLDKKITDLAKRLRVTLPDRAMDEQRKQLKDLQKKAHTRAYDRLWLQQAAAGHVQALKMLDDEIAQGKNTDVREAARTARPVVADHLKRVQVCQKKR
ncbi:DUF4142 domain-containing protein [Streptomyces hiroshimensis]|uniref:DUF4142 domain-containing protein n=1 Tax=Streptomyces hiroshimensis TaxID=66424 RepID=A0ABQ2YLX8_9ACTN|nr:DUF4142 domain-containing protein [Streptomyces hiroshimensis]GGX87492.1 hypothetical protein GCM10010324_36310 [Streptomyces hiroshimensis]